MIIRFISKLLLIAIIFLVVMFTIAFNGIVVSLKIFSIWSIFGFIFALLVHFAFDYKSKKEKLKDNES